MAYSWINGQTHKAAFVMIDANGSELTGLTLSVELSKNGAAFAAGVGSVAEIGDGWYTYTTGSGETDTNGPLAIKITAAGAVQQNLLAVISTWDPVAVQYDYIVTEAGSGDPIQGATVSISTDLAGSNMIFTGTTNATGVLKSMSQPTESPWLSPGTYYFWSYHPLYEFTNPDTEVVS